MAPQNPNNARARHAASVLGLFALVTFTLGHPTVPGLTSGSIGVAQAASARGGKRSQSAKDFEYEVSDCLEAGRQDSMGLIVSDDSIRFNHVFTMNCVAATRPGTVKVLYSKKGRNLEVSVVLRSTMLADCSCPIEIDGKIANLGKGTYRLSFVYDAKVGDSPDDKPTRQSLGTKEFTIR
jgi:hypothetical protein